MNFYFTVGDVWHYLDKLHSETTVFTTAKDVKDTSRPYITLDTLLSEMEKDLSREENS